MMKVECSKCKAENAQGAKFCTQCGEPLVDKAEQEDKSDDRFKTIVAFLIAIVSMVGAVLAFRITIAAGNAADEDVAGVVSSVNLHQARVAGEADLYRDLGAYLQVRIHDQISHNLIAERDRYPGEDPIRDELWDEGWTETYVAESYLDQLALSPEYLRSDGSYDEQAYLDIQGAEWALKADFNREGHFAEAERLRTKVQLLMGVAFILGVALFFYTLAEVVTHKSKYAFVVLGSGVFVVALVAMLVIEVTMS
jgi:hypothetical protein